MGFLSFIPVIGKIIEKGLDIVDDLVEDKDKANELKAAIKSQILVNQHEELVPALENQTKIILAEARGGWLQRNWRPLLMMIIVLIVANNYLLYPYLSLFWEGARELSLPAELWSLMKIGVGGYVAGRSVEKGIDLWKNGNNRP